MRAIKFVMILLMSLGAFTYSFAQQPIPQADQQAYDNKIQELELKIENLEKRLGENSNNTKGLIDSAFKTVDYAKSINWAVTGLALLVTTIVALSGIASGILLRQVTKKLSLIDTAKKALEKEIYLQRITAEARLLLQYKQREQAEKRGKKMREQNPDYPWGFYILGLYLKWKGDIQGAYEAMLKANELSEGDSGVINFNLACYAALNNEKDVAMMYLEKAHYLMPEMFVERKLNSDPDLTSLRNYEKFEEFCKSRKLPPIDGDSG